MPKNSISYKELYELVDDRTQVIMNKFDQLDGRVSILEGWKREIIAQVTLATGLIAFVASLVADKVKRSLGL